MSIREIKFRGKHVDGKWVYGYFYKEHSSTEGGDYWIKSASTGNHLLIIPETLGEYTGLKDKRGYFTNK